MGAQLRIHNGTITIDVESFASRLETQAANQEHLAQVHEAGGENTLGAYERGHAGGLRDVARMLREM